jgi:hypothetical protein
MVTLSNYLSLMVRHHKHSRFYEGYVHSTPFDVLHEADCLYMILYVMLVL